MCFLFLVNSNLSSYLLLVFRLVLVRYNNLDGLGFYSPSCSILELLLQKGALEVRTPVSPFNCNKITSYLHVSRFNLVAHYLYMKPNF